MAGVYAIRCIPTDELYIGGTRMSFEIRFGMHRRRLRTNTGSTPRLQAAWNKYGEQSFEFIPLKAFPKEEVHAREREAIMKVRPTLNWPSDLLGWSDQQISPQLLRYRKNIGLTGAALYAPPRMNTETFEVDGEWLTRSELAERAGIGHAAMCERIKRGLSGKALVKPPRRK